MSSTAALGQLRLFTSDRFQTIKGGLIQIPKAINFVLGLLI